MDASQRASFSRHLKSFYEAYITYLGFEPSTSTFSNNLWLSAGKLNESTQTQFDTTIIKNLSSPTLLKEVSHEKQVYNDSHGGDIVSDII